MKPTTKLMSCSALVTILFLMVGSASANPTYPGYPAFPAYPPPGPSQRVYLGSSFVEERYDHDTIHVGRMAGPFGALQLRVSGGAVDIHQIVVHYGNGFHESLRVYSRVPPGSVSPPIVLSGRGRTIQSVDLWYGKAHWQTRPKVSLYGLR